MILFITHFLINLDKLLVSALLLSNIKCNKPQIPVQNTSNGRNRDVFVVIIW